MTREQAQSLIQSEPKAWEVIDEIYNDFEQQLANLKHNYEMQEIVIADYKKCIAELETPKTCYGCRFDDYPNRFNALHTCITCCQYDHYEPKGSE